MCTTALNQARPLWHNLNCKAGESRTPNIHGLIFVFFQRGNCILPKLLLETQCKPNYYTTILNDRSRAGAR